MRDLIFDIGANNGDDTAFYLKKGFRVVAIEADPALAQKLYDRFAEDIAAGNVVIEGVGVSDKVSSLEFYVNSHASGALLSSRARPRRRMTSKSFGCQPCPCRHWCSVTALLAI